MYAVFDKNLQLDNELIDSQHKELIDRINDLIKSCEEKKDAEEAMKMLDFLVDYTHFHFSAEEKLQEDMQFPGIDRHKAQHREFVETVGQLKDKLAKEGPTDEFVDLVNEKVTEWLYGHIKVFDRAVADFKPYIGSASHPEKMG